MLFYIVLKSIGSLKFGIRHAFPGMYPRFNSIFQTSAGICSKTTETAEFKSGGFFEWAIALGPNKDGWTVSSLQRL